MWSAEEIRAHRARWTLESDSRLLAHLKDFAKKLEDNSKSVAQRIDEVKKRAQRTTSRLSRFSKKQEGKLPKTETFQN